MRIERISKPAIRFLQPRALPSGSVIFCFQAEDGIRHGRVTGVQTCALPIFDPFRSRAVLSGQVKPDSTNESAGSVNAAALAPPLEGRQKVSPSMNTGILLRSYPAVSQCVVSSVARKIAPGIHSGRSRGAAVFEISGGASPAAAVSAFAPLSGATLAMLDNPRSLFAARSPAPPYPINTPPDRTHAFSFSAPSSPSSRRIRPPLPSGMMITLKVWRSSTRPIARSGRSEEHTSELQSPVHLVCRLL